MNANTEIATTATPATTPRAKLSAIEKIERTSNAWRTCAPEAKFANKNWAEFRSATEMSRFYRTKLTTLDLQLKSSVAARSQADNATRTMLNKVIAGVKADDGFGPDSALYRAMGFIPPLERKRPGSRKTENADAPKTPKSHNSLMERVAKVRSGWAEIAPNDTIVGVSLAQFDEAVAASIAARAGSVSDKTNRRGVISLRNAADVISLALVQRVVSSIKADEAYGPESPLYRALGYIPASERRSPRAAATATITPAAPAQ